jgi:hypothetical protein
MTLLSRFFTFFPMLVLALAACSILWIARAPSLLSVASLPAVLYGFPLLVYRIHQLAFPIRTGLSDLDGEDYSPWWGGHQIQWVYVAFPALEAALRSVPGLFSAWLRAWGSAVGEGVYWTPGIEIADRGLLQIETGAVFGHRTGLSSHIITRRRGRLVLLVKPVSVGARAFIGAGCVLGPGASVAPDAVVPAGTPVRPGESWD